MKSIIVVLAILFSSALVVSAEDTLVRDYWPTAGWRIAVPEKQEMSSSKLDMVSAHVKENMPKLTNITVIRHGYIVLEVTTSGDSSTLRQVYSVAKSVLSAIIGVAIREGYIKDINQKLVDYFPKLRKNASPEVATITLRHLLTLSDGISRSDMDNNFSGFDPTQKLRASPGKELFYNSMSPQILSIILKEKTGLTALDFGKKYLFGPLGISNVTWEEINGCSNGATNIYLTTRDMAKLGYLYLNKGMWDGKQLVPKEWVVASTKSQIDAPNVPYFKIKFTYGFYWWLHPVGKYQAFSAVGYGGQFITVVPDVDLVVVITTSDWNHGNAPGYLSLIEEFILPAILH